MSVEPNADTRIVAETPRLVLRTWQLDDAEPAHAIFGDPEVMRFVSPVHRSIEETRQMLDRGIAYQSEHGFCRWAVVEKTTNRLIGGCGFKKLALGGVDIGFYFARQKWGHGFAIEAGLASLAVAFDELNIEKVIGLTDPMNFRSQETLLKLGFSFIKSSWIEEFSEDRLWYETTRAERDARQVNSQRC